MVLVEDIVDTGLTLEVLKGEGVFRVCLGEEGSARGARLFFFFFFCPLFFFLSRFFVVGGSNVVCTADGHTRRK